MKVLMDELIALRLGALRLARRRGRTRDAAWAASRLRLDGVHLEPADARFARAMQLRLGRALRVARIRRERSAGPNVTMPTLGPVSRSWRRPIVAVLLAVLMLLALSLSGGDRPIAGGEPERAALPQSAIIATPPPPLRGRSQPGLTLPIAIVAGTPAPAPPPAPAPEGAGTTSNGNGAGGSGGGTGSGNKGATASPSATPAAAATPFIDPRNLVHVQGRVIDGSTRVGVANVCISYGTLECSLAPHTDTNGNFDIPLDGRSSWIFRFIARDYITVNLGTIRLRPGPPINVGIVILRRAP